MVVVIDVGLDRASKKTARRMVKAWSGKQIRKRVAARLDTLAERIRKRIVSDVPKDFRYDYTPAYGAGGYPRKPVVKIDIPSKDGDTFKLSVSYPNAPHARMVEYGTGGRSLAGREDPLGPIGELTPTTEYEGIKSFMIPAPGSGNYRVEHDAPISLGAGAGNKFVLVRGAQRELHGLDPVEPGHSDLQIFEKDDPDKGTFVSKGVSNIIAPYQYFLAKRVNVLSPDSKNPLTVNVRAGYGGVSKAIGIEFGNMSLSLAYSFGELPK